MGIVTIHSPPNLRDKAARALWLIVWTLFFRPSPTPLFWWRRFLLRLFGAEVGSGAHPYSSARIWAPWNLVMEAGSCLAAGADCYCVDKIVLGRDAIISQRAFLCTATHDHRQPGFKLMTGPVIIGENAWVAAEAYIGPGVTLGAGAVAGARAVVVRDVPPGAVVVGNPARLIASEVELASSPVRMPSPQVR
jgi:putative colanic acid biosynthesis acetyltransferase WcaF